MRWVSNPKNLIISRLTKSLGQSPGKESIPKKPLLGMPTNPRPIITVHKLTLAGGLAELLIDLMGTQG
jgi:hypothetical protein